jgi:hypothetical protein
MAIQFAPGPEMNPMLLARLLEARKGSEGGSDMDRELFKMFAQQMQSGGDYSPVQSPWQAAARVVGGLAGGMQMNRLLENDRKNNAEQTKTLQMLPNLNQATPQEAAPPPSAPPTVGPPMSEFSPANPAQSGIATPPGPQSMVAPSGQLAGGPDMVAQAFPPQKPPGPGLLSANPPSTHEIINAAKGGIAQTPMPRPNPQALAAALAQQQPQQAQPQRQVMASDGMPAPRPPGSIPAPGVISSLSPRAQQAFNPLAQKFAEAGLPVNITSGYRDPSHNAAVGGARGSQHTHRNAIDMSLKGMTEAQKRQAVAIAQSTPGINGFGYYPSSDSIHIDARPGGRAAWGQNYSKSSIGQGWPDWMTRQTQAWRAGQNGQPTQMAQAQQQGSVPLPRPRPTNIPQDQPQQPPEMSNAPVRLAALGGAPSREAPYPPQQNPAASAQPNMQMAQAQQPSQKPRSGLTQQQIDWYNRAVANPKTRELAVRQLQEWQKPVEYKPVDLGNEVGFTDSQGRVIRREPKKQDTDDIREYNTYVQQSKEAGQKPMPFVDYVTSIKRAGATAITNDMRGENEFSKQAATHQVKRFDEIVQTGYSAKALRADLQTLRDLRSGFETGKVAEIKTALGPYAEALGVKIDNLGDMQAYDAIVAKLAPRMRVPGSGATSDFEMQQYLKSLPGLGKTPEGNAIIENTMEAIQNHQEKAAEIASMALNKEITPKEADKMLRELPDPMTAFKEFKKTQEKAAGSTGIKWERGPDGKPRPVAQ